jgi:hypothetical protein
MPAFMSRDSDGSTSLAAQHDLTFGDVSGEVGDRMGHVAVGKRNHRQLGDRPGAVLQDPRPLEQRSQVRVHVAGITAPPWDLFARRCNFP